MRSAAVGVRGTRPRLACVAAAAGLLAGCSGIQSALDPAGPQAERISQLWWLSLAISGAVFTVVMGFMLYAATAARRRGGAAAPEPTAERRMTRAITIAVAASVIVLFAWLVASIAAGRSLTSLAASDVPGAGKPLTIEVIGHQWWWEVHYNAPEANQRLETANEIHVPVGRRVVLRMTSRDVIHSFWVPNLNGKRDLIPGYTSTTWFQADTPGVYRGQCAEYCGHQHAKMALLIIAQPPAQFAAWYQQQLRSAPPPTDSLTRRGQQVFLSGTCAMCHTVQGTMAGGRMGPSLTHIGSRRTIAAGTLPNTRGHLGGWILDPQRIKPGVRMPPNELSPDDLQALLTYLESLK